MRLSRAQQVADVGKVRGRALGRMGNPMRDETADLLALRAQLSGVVEACDRLALRDQDTPRSPDDREIVAVTASIVGGFRPRTRADVLRFVRAVKAGDEAWLVVHAMPGDHGVDAAYFAHLPREVRGLLG